MRDGGGRQRVEPVDGRSSDGDGPLIDLDATRPGQPAPPALPARLRASWRRWRSRRIPLPLVVVLLVPAAVAGGVATRWWTVRHDRLADESTVSLQVVGEGQMTGGGGSGPLAEVTSSILVVNSGPLPVELTDLRVAHGPLTLRSLRSDVVRPGTRPFTVRLTFSCADGVPNEPVPVVVSVRTADGTSRRTSSLMATKPWQYAYDVLCRAPGRR
ncbi:hypothetical protein [Micromonospora sp. URMC 103]|uniref:hypothetical protein n=1 Tax=Micromonospora sp. URMC 103 TaxID=3423406 RepID=UPI003F19FB3B